MICQTELLYGFLKMCPFNVGNTFRASLCVCECVCCNEGWAQVLFEI